MTIDSGATETVIGPRILLKVPITQSAQSIRGVRYEVANGVQIRNEGEQQVEICTGNNQRRVLALQVCDVNKCLLSTAKLNEAGQRIMLDGDRSYIEDVKSGDKILVRYHNRVYYLKVWVRAVAEGGVQAVLRKEDTCVASGFTRQGM